MHDSASWFRKTWFTRRRVRKLKNAHNSVTVQNWTHVYMNFFQHKDLGNHLLQLCPKVVKHPVYWDGNRVDEAHSKTQPDYTVYCNCEQGNMNIPSAAVTLSQDSTASSSETTCHHSHTLYHVRCWGHRQKIRSVQCSALPKVFLHTMQSGR